MTNSRLQPKAVLWWGIILAVAGALLTVLLPNISFFFASSRDSAIGVDQGILVLLEVIVRVIHQIVPPLGAALIGAGIVMAYSTQARIERESEGRTTIGE